MGWGGLGTVAWPGAGDRAGARRRRRGPRTPVVTARPAQAARPAPPVPAPLPCPLQYGEWSPNTSVVSIGATRRFVFREAFDHAVRWSYRVASGDVVTMFGDCQERLQHAVAVERHAGDAGPRVSLVFKQRLAPACAAGA